MTSSSNQGLPYGVPLPEIPPRHVLNQAIAVDAASAHKVEVGIPTREGIELAADVFLPPADRRPAPAVVIGTPYDKSTPSEPGRVWQEAGYVGVVYDVRGRGKSEGEWHPHVHEPQDAYDVVEWVAAQEWCNGDVGLTGISYLGGMVWKTLSQRPPHLKAAISTAPEGRWQEECPFAHGCFWLYYVYWWSLVRRRILDQSRDVGAMIDTLPVGAIGEMLDPAGPGWNEMMEHDTLDALWRSRRWDGEYDFDLPVLHVGAWHDGDAPNGIFHHYEQMLSTSPASDRQWLLVGPWAHTSARHPDDQYAGVEYPGAGIDMNAIHKRFFDRFLRGVDNGFDMEPRVVLYDTGTKAWQVREGWQDGTVEYDLFLSEGEGLALSPASDGEVSYRYDPMDAPGVRFDVNSNWEPPLDLGQLEAHPGVLAWSTAPLEKVLTVQGWGELELWAASDCEDTEWHIKIADVSPEGRSLWVTDGCLRASYGDDPSDPQPIVPEEVRRYSIELNPAFHSFLPGHRLRLTLASAEYPWFARSMNRFGPISKLSDPAVAINTIHFGNNHPSRLRLRVELA